jgi:hypothetical protein
MAAPSSGNIICIRGTLSFNGTVLGMLRDMVFEPNSRDRLIYAEEWGTHVDDIYLGDAPIFRGVLRYPDADALTVFPPAGTFSYAYNQSQSKPGTPQASRAGVMLFTPTAPLAHPGIKFYSAIPSIDDAAKLQLSLGEEYGLAVSFTGIPDSQGRVYAVGLVGGLP